MFGCGQLLGALEQFDVEQRVEGAGGEQKERRHARIAASSMLRREPSGAAPLADADRAQDLLLLLPVSNDGEEFDALAHTLPVLASVSHFFFREEGGDSKKSDGSSVK